MKFLSLLVLVIAVSALQHKCAHEKHQKAIPPPPPLPEGRSLQSLREDNYEKIRIHIEYGDLDVSSSDESLIKDKIIHGTEEWYENILSIKRLNTNLIMGLDDCYGVTVPDSHQTTGVAADVIIYVTAGQTDDSAVGWAVVCALTSDGYPAAGRLHLESQAFAFSSFEDVLSTSIHEVAHILAFNSELYSYFTTQPVTSTGTARGVSVSSIVTPTVVSRARTAFNCGTMNGIELESQGGSGTAGSHWEKRIMHNDFMVADSDIQDVVYSDLTMALFQDSGWYSVDYDYTTGIVWGKNEGCDFLEDKCIQSQQPAFSEFCTSASSVERCDFMHLHKGYCNIVDHGAGAIPSAYQYFTNSGEGGSDPFLDYCPVIKQRSGGNCRGHDLTKTDLEDSKWEEEAGENSRCVEGTFVKSGSPYDHAACVEVVKCNDSSVDLSIDGNTVNCPFTGGDVSIPGYDGVVNCPASSVLCENMPCMNHCSGLGVCKNGKCVCDNGNSDPDCGGGDISDDFGAAVIAFAIALVI